MWWTDQRLAWDQERTCVGSIQLLDGPANIWVPDFYFPPSVDHKIGAKNDGQVSAMASWHLVVFVVSLTKAHLFE